MMKLKSRHELTDWEDISSFAQFRKLMKDGKTVYKQTIVENQISKSCVLRTEFGSEVVITKHKNVKEAKTHASWIKVIGGE